MNTTQLHATPVDTTDYVETFEQGTYGTGAIKRMVNGERILEFLNLNTNGVIQTPSQEVDLNGETLEETLRQACQLGTPIPTFLVTDIKGPKAFVKVFESKSPSSSGKSRSYATIIKLGVRPLKFSLNRIDLETMKSESIHDALKKVAFVTGSIKLKTSPKL
jgi:hypothetical protein